MSAENVKIYYHNNDAETGIRGSLFLGSVEFPFTLRAQKSGAYCWRGRMSIVSPKDGRRLQVTGAEKKRRLETEKGAMPGLQDHQKGKRNQKLNITRSIQTNFENPEKREAYLIKCARELYAENAALINKQLGQSSRPETITPAVACALYGEEFINTYHRNAKQTTNMKYLQCLKKVMSYMPDVPMSQYSKRMIKQAFKGENVSSQAQKLLFDFWAFCLQKGYCAGGNPIDKPEAKKKSPAALQADAIKADTLSDEQQEKLYIILSESATGFDCGVALQWSGFSIEVVCALTWDKVLLDDAREDFVLVDYHREDLAGTVHDYTRPVIPQCARILRRRYAVLTERFSVTEIMRMPIVSAEKNECVCVPYDRLVKYGSLVLRKAGVGERTFAVLKDHKQAVSRRLLGNSYEHNLIHRCGLSNDFGTLNFLLGHAIEDVTSAHYTSFTSNEAKERLYAILQRLRPLEAIKKPESPIILNNGKREYIVVPDDTAHTAGLVTPVVLRPGEEISISCSHGVYCNVRARVINSDGSVRRKSRSRKE